MASVTNNLESGEDSDVEVDAGSMAGFAGAAVNQRSLATSHAMLSKFAWLRVLLERELQKRSYQLMRVDGAHAFIVTPAFDRLTLPWAPFPNDDYNKFGLWSLLNKKMGCPSFALPAGGLFTGGTCPGADAAQTITPIEKRVKLLHATPNGWMLPMPVPGTSAAVPVKEGLTICSACYATGGNFSYASNQLAEIIRYWWLRKHLEGPGRPATREGASPAEVAERDAKYEEVKAVGFNFLVSTFLESIQRLEFPSDRHGIKPIRLHDSGDFFSYAYAKLWLRIADELAVSNPTIVLWAPTRTWASGHWSSFWADELPKLRSLQTAGRPNLVVRASGYNFGDYAPGALHPTNARGSTSLYMPTAKVPEDLRNRTNPITTGLTDGAEPRVDFNCGVYGAAKEDSKKATCSNAKAPDGKPGCRACWIHPELSVNYAAH